MLFMVIECFKGNDGSRVGERFRQYGRMLPDDVRYEASWMETDGGRCFQIMEAPRVESLEPWISRWNDLVDFEIIPVRTSQDYWAKAGEQQR